MSWFKCACLWIHSRALIFQNIHFAAKHVSILCCATILPCFLCARICVRHFHRRCLVNYAISCCVLVFIQVWLLDVARWHSVNWFKLSNYVSSRQNVPPKRKTTLFVCSMTEQNTKVWENKIYKLKLIQIVKEITNVWMSKLHWQTIAQCINIGFKNIMTSSIGATEQLIANPMVMSCFY